MRRKFSFDIPRLKLSTASKPGNTTAAANASNERPESPPTPVTPIPQTLIHLPTELDAALRRACTLVVEPHRAPNDVFDFQCEATRAAVNYATIKGGLDAMLDADTPAAAGGSKYSYKPDVPVEDLFKNEDRTERLRKQIPQVLLLQSAAAARVEQLMAPAKESTSLQSTSASTVLVQQRSMTVITHSADSPTLSATGSADVSKPSSAHSDRPLTGNRDVAAKASEPENVLPLHPLQQNPPAPQLADSDDSTLQSPVDDEDDEHNRWNSSTGMTSAVITPAKGHTSKRASEQQAAAANSRETDVDRTQGRPSEVGAKIPTAVRKPTSSDSRPGSRQAGEYSRSAIQTDDQDEHIVLSRSPAQQQSYRVHQNPDTSRPNPRSRDQHAYQPPRSDSRAEYDPFSSQHVYQPAGMPARPQSTEPTHTSRPRTGSLTQHVREYFRPGSTTGSRKPSVDLSRVQAPPRPASRTGGGRSRSRSRGRGEASDAAYDESAAADSSVKRSTSVSRWRPWRSSGQGKQFPTPDYSRPGSATGWLSHRTRSRSGTGDSTSIDASTPASSVMAQSLERNDSATAATKKPINLNRELPPLPGLDQWRPEWDENADGAWGKASERQKAVELRDRQAQQEEALAAKMGPTSPSQTQRDLRHDQQQRSIPLQSAGRHQQSQTQSRSQSRTDSRQTGHSSNASTSTQQYAQTQSRRETPSPTTRNMYTSTSGKTHAPSQSYGGAPISIYNHSTSTQHTRTASQMNSNVASRQQPQHVQLLPAPQGKSASVSPLSLCPPSPSTAASASASNSAATTPADFHTPPIMPSPYLVSPLDAPGGGSRWPSQVPLQMQPSPRMGHSRASSAGAERILSRSTDATALPSPRLANGEQSPAFGGPNTNASSRFDRALPSSPPADRKYSLDGGLALSAHTYNPRWAAAAAAAHSQEMLNPHHPHQQYHGSPANHGYSPQHYSPATPKKDVASPTEKLLRRKWWLPSKEKDRADRERRAPAFLKALAA